MRGACISFATFLLDLVIMGHSTETVRTPLGARTLAARTRQPQQVLTPDVYIQGGSQA